MKKILTICALLCASFCGAFAQLNVQTTSNTSCGTPNGSASASVGGTTTGYTFEWRIGTDGTNPVFFTGPVASNLSAGIYQVHAIDQSTSTDIGSVLTVVTDAIVLTEATIQTTSNTDCEGNPNGSLTATVNGTATDYTFSWYQGTSATGSPIGTGASLSNVSAGIYTVKVTNLITSCFTVVTAQVPLDCQISSPGFSGVANELITSKKKAGSSSVSFYPNPANTVLFIKSQVNASISLIDREGTTIVTRSVSSAADPFTLDLSGVKPGKYILRVSEVQKTANYQVIVKK